MVPWVVEGQAPVEVRARPSTLALEVGQQERVFVSAFDSRGRLVPYRGFSFATTDTATARVEPDGTVTGIGAGSATIVIRAGFAVAEVRVAVFSPDSPPAMRSAPREPVALETTSRRGGRTVIEPNPVQLLPGELQRPSAFLEWPDGSRVERMPTDWVSTDTTVVQIDPSGVLRARTPGRARIIVRLEAEAAADTVSVLVNHGEFRTDRSQIVMRPGDLDTVAVLVPSQGNRRLTTGLRWWVVNPSIARVGPTGIVQALGLGSTELVIQGFQQERRLPVVVHRPVSRLTLMPSPGPDPLPVPLLGTRSVTVTPTSADSLPVPEALLEWGVADSTIAEFDPVARKLHGKQSGTTSLTLRVRGFDPIAWAIRVEPMAIAIEQAHLVIEPTASDTLVARFNDPSGMSIGQASGVVWSSSPAGIVSVDSAGVILGLREGRATATAATPWGAVAASTVHVVADLVLVIDRAQAGSAIAQVRSHDPSRVTEVLRDGAANRSPVFSPDRTTIAFASDRVGDSDIFLIDPAGGSVVRLTESAGDQTHPAWMPDGQSLVFASQENGRSQILITGVLVRRIRALATAPDGETYSRPAISPDGGTLFFIVSDTAGSDLAVLNLTAVSRGVRRVARDVDPEIRPVPLEGGQVLYARGTDGGGSTIFRLNLRSGTSTAVYSTDRPISAMAVSRDGETLVFVSDSRLWRGSLAMMDPVIRLSLPTFERVTDPSF
jgi:hypothetical protein